MPIYCQDIPKILSRYCHNIAKILSIYCQDIAKILPKYCKGIVKILLWYCRDIAKILLDIVRIWAQKYTVKKLFMGGWVVVGVVLVEYEDRSKPINYILYYVHSNMPSKGISILSIDNCCWPIVESCDISTCPSSFYVVTTSVRV